MVKKISEKEPKDKSGSDKEKAKKVSGSSAGKSVKTKKPAPKIVSSREGEKKPSSKAKISSVKKPSKKVVIATSENKADVIAAKSAGSVEIKIDIVKTPDIISGAVKEAKPEMKNEIKTPFFHGVDENKPSSDIKTESKVQMPSSDEGASSKTSLNDTVQAEPPAEGSKFLEFDTPIALKDLASRLGVKPNEIILELMSKSIFATINQNLGEELVVNILGARNIEYRKPPKLEEQISKEHREMESRQDTRQVIGRAPVVTFMGHVDHGKTSLLDFIRKTRVADKEKGGITQHIGAYEVKLPKGSVTFLDTPGHEAFTAMRARGANATDVVVLVVAADDGVMPQTKEALDHARAANVTIVVALNKCDLPSANIDKVKGQLAQIGLTPEDWGGKTIVLPVSAKTGEGVDNLLEMLLLESELLELKANPNLRARGIVIEGKLSSGQGPIATVLVKNGTLRLGDMVLTGMHYGRIKAMIDHTGHRIQEAPPSKPVTILGLSGVPMAGDEFFVVKDEKKAKILSNLKQDEERSARLKMSHRVTLEDFYSKLKEGATKELAILLKGDVQGSVEALKASLLELNTKDVKVTVIHDDVGNINESDIMLAAASNAVVIGFNVRADERSIEIASKEGIEIKNYGIIYEAIEDVKAAMEGLLEPVIKEVFFGRAFVKQVFRVTKAGTIAGSQVSKGRINRTGIAKLIRNKEIVYEGKIISLKRFKDDVREVNEGVECGISLSGHDDIRVGDTIEVYQIEKVARRLDSRK